MTDTAISGDYVDLKFIKTRKVCQIVIEIPIEQGETFVRAFGTPAPDTGVPVALARLTSTPAAEKPKRSWSDMSRAQQAGIACEDEAFASYIDSKHPHLCGPVEAVRELCGVISRAELDKQTTAGARWDKLYSDYQLWKRGAAA